MSVYSTRDFIGKPAPLNYVAGLGRGATGFTTRSDIGPAREDAMEAGAAAMASATGANNTTVTADGAVVVLADSRFADNENEEGLLGTGPYDAEDREADAIYAAIDKAMEQRRGGRRRNKRPLDGSVDDAAADDDGEGGGKKPVDSVHQQFAELKRGLSQLSEAEWAALPEPGDLRAVGRKMRKEREKERERYTAAPDSVILAARAQLQHVGVLDPASNNGTDTPASGTRTVVMGGAATPVADFRQISKARDDLLRVRLDQAGGGGGGGDASTTGTPGSSGTVTSGGSSTVDPKGYLTAMSSMVLKTDAEVGDIKKARELLKSVITTNPQHAPGWIAAARLEEIDGKLGHARSLIARGCEECPGSEDVWLEAARLNTTADNAKVILANAVRHIPTSTRVWLKAAELESTTAAKKRVLRKALEYIPNSVRLWRAAVDLEQDQEDARLLLSRAVECVPLAVELWLALARLETYEAAQRVLNRARAACPSSHEVWVAAAKLAAAAGDDKKCDVVVAGAVRALGRIGANLSREQWLREAEECERQGSVAACQAIVRRTIGQDVDPEDREQTWLADADALAQRGSIQTARAVYVHALKEFLQQSESLWLQAAFFERDHGTGDSLQELLRRAVRYHPHSETLWLMGAKDRWLRGDVDGARQVLEEAFKANGNSETIWLAAVKLETETGEYARGQQFLAKARQEASSPRVWVKSVALERNLGHADAARELVLEALQLYPTHAKLWMMRGQLEEAAGQVQQARDTYAAALKQCPKSEPLWLLAARLEYSKGGGQATRARALLDRARLINPHSPALWLETVRMERRAGNATQSRVLLDRALHDCPTAGTLWAEAIFMEPRPSARKTKSVDALKRCDNDVAVVTAVARLFWLERNVAKARSWFGRALKLSPDAGDTWAWLYKFELEYGSSSSANNSADTSDSSPAKVIERCVAADPHHGEVWQRVAKDPANWRLGTKDILVLTAAALGDSDADVATENGR